MQYALLNAKRLTCHAWSSRTCQKHFSRSVAVFAMGGPKRYKLSEKAVLTLQLGDLTRWEGDAIVNAANEMMLGGGGVDGAIHDAAGPGLLAACRASPEVSPRVRCPTGEARITKGFDLPAKHVIHTVGPIYENEAESRPLLFSAYKSSLALANQHKFQRIAFPAISCGIYGYPIPDAAKVSIEACQEHVGKLEEICFVLFGRETFNAYSQVASEKLEAAE